MPRTRSLAWSELKIGVLTIAAMVIAAVTIFMLTGGRGFFWQRYTLKTRFANVAGLKPGSPVRVAGVEVGSVTDVEFAGDQVDVVVRGEQGRPAADHDKSIARARVGLAARRERGGHHAVVDGHAHPGMGLRADGQAAGRAGGRHRPGAARASAS